MSKLDWVKPSDDADKESRRRHGYHRTLKLAIFITAAPVLCYLVACIGTFVVPHAVGYLVTAFTRYGDAELVYSGEDSYGGKDWASRAFVFWTDRSSESVHRHYTHYFALPAWTTSDQHRWSAEQPYPAFSILWFLMDEFDVTYSIRLSVIDASRQSEWPLRLCCYYTGVEHALSKLPRNGTVIIVTHEYYNP